MVLSTNASAEVTHLNSWDVSSAWGLDVNPVTGNVYIPEASNLVTVYTPNGTLVNSFVSPNGGGSAFGNWSWGLEVSPDGSEVYVADTADKRIEVFDANTGSFKRMFGSFTGNTDVTIAPTGAGGSMEVYVADRWAHTIQKFTPAGSSLGQWNGGTYPVGTAVDSSGNVYTSPGYDNVVKKFTSDGTHLSDWAGEGFNFMSHIDVSVTDEVYATDGRNNRIQVFDPSGSVQRIINLPGWTFGVDIMPNGELFVSYDPSQNDTPDTVGRYFDSEAWISGTYPVAADATIGSTVLGTVLSVTEIKDLDVTGTVSVGDGSLLEMLGGEFAAGEMEILTGGEVRFDASNLKTIELAGTLTAGGSLTVDAEGMQFEQNDVLELFNAASFAGQFDAITLPALAEGLEWSTESLYADGTVSVVPEPATLSLLGIGALGLVRRKTK
jgi:hypothetical protein